MKCVITGGLGFIGTHLAERLIEGGHDVVIVDSLTPQIHGDIPSINPPETAKVFRLDIRSIASHSEIFEGCDVVYHLASETGTAQSMYNVSEYVAVNEGGTAALISALANCSNRPKRLVLTSSRSVYGEGGYTDLDSRSSIFTPSPRTREQLLKEEWDPTHVSFDDIEAVATKEECDIVPSSIYAATKSSQEHLVRIASDSLGITSVILRLQNVYGERQSLKNPYTGIISIFYNRARQGLSIPIYEDGMESRDFVHVEDVVFALVSAGQAALENGAIVNIGSGKPTTVLDLAKTLLKAGALDVPVKVTGQFRVGDIRHGWADIQKARELLGFAPKISLEDGIKRFTSWATGQPTYEDRLDKATEELKSRGLTN